MKNQEVKIVNLENGEIYIGKVYQERKSSLLIKFSVGLLPFSKKTGKIFGKNVQQLNPYALQLF